MPEIYMLQPVTSSCHLFAPSGRRFAAEPKLDELMHDPIMLALMAADRVSHCELHTLFAQVRENLR